MFLIFVDICGNSTENDAEKYLLIDLHWDRIYRNQMAEFIELPADVWQEV